MAGSAFDRVNGVLVDRVILVDSQGAAITEDNPAGVDVKLSVIGDAGNADAICTGAYRGWLETIA